jgi:tetratricopeptide (TPR) repeat protein
MLDRADYQRVREAFLAVCDRTPPEREEFLAAALAGTPHLRGEVVELLAQHDRETGWLQTADIAAARARLIVEPPPRVGPFVLRERIGLGGMGVVHRATQDEPRRDVAVKLLRPDLLTPAGIARVQQEAAFLARLQHPAIVSILMAGSEPTPAGPLPWLAMPLVEGVTLDRAVRERRLGREAIVELLIEIADAVQHAHQKGILHRDLKPANVLVDASGRPRILDFGIGQAARGDDQRTAGRPVRERVGTLPYMSPEQQAGDAAAIDTRTDVYALGVIACELLTGLLPPALAAAGRSLVRELGDLGWVVQKAIAADPGARYAGASAFAADLRRVRDGLPVTARPQTFAYQARCFARRHRAAVAIAVAFVGALLAGIVGTTLGMYRAEAAQQRSAEAERHANDALAYLQGLLRGANRDVFGREADFAAVFERAADDLPRAFADRPVALAAMQRTLGATLLAMGRPQAARKCLQPALALHRELYGPWNRETLVVATSLLAAERVLGEPDVLPRMRDNLQAHRQALGGGSADTANVAMDLASALVGTGAVGEALAVLERTLADVQAVHGAASALALQLELDSCSYALLASPGQEAEARLADAIRRAAVVLGDDHAVVLRARGNLGTARLKRLDHDGAAEVLRPLSEQVRTTLGADHPFTQQVLQGLAQVEFVRDPARAIGIYEELLPGLTARLGERSHEVLDASLGLAGLYVGAGSRGKGKALMAKIADACLAPTAPAEMRRTAAHLSARIALGEQDYAGAAKVLEPMLREGLDGGDAVVLKNNLASIYVHLGRLDEAEALLQEVLAYYEATSPADSLHRLRPTTILGGLQKRQGNLAAAAATFRSALALAEQAFGPDHVETANVCHNLGLVLSDMGAAADALPLFERAYEGREAALPVDQTEVVDSLSMIAVALGELDRPGEALPHHREVLERRRRGAGPNSPLALTAQQNLIYCLGETGALAEAEELATDLQRRCAVTVGLPIQARVIGDLAMAFVHRKRGRPELAEPLVRAVRESTAAVADGWWRAALDHLLGQALLEQGRAEDAAPLLRTAFEQRVALRGPSHRRTGQSRDLLAQALRALGRAAEADALPAPR